MKKGSITRFKLNPKKPPKTDWRAFDAMSEEERHRAAVSDSDAPPATDAQLARARRVPTVRALRKKLNLTQEEFAARFHLPLGTVRDWEQGASSRQGCASAANGHRKRPGRGGARARKLEVAAPASAAQLASWWFCAVQHSATAKQ